MVVTLVDIVMAICYIFCPLRQPSLFIHVVLTEKTGRLAMDSQKYKTSARQLNLSTSLAMKIALAVGVFLFILFIYFWFF